MRNNIVSLGADELKYEIREIVSVAKEFGRLGLDVTWENIGDPVQKGEKLPILITVMDTEEKINKVIPILDEFVGEGIVVLSDVNVIKYTHRDAGAEGLA